MTEQRSETWKVLAAFAAIYLIWGTTYLAMRIGVETIPPFAMAATRFLLAGIPMFFLLRRFGIAGPTPRQWRDGALIGVLFLVGGNGLVTWSEQEVPSGIAALVVATMPLWLTLLEWLFYGGSRPSLRITCGLVLGMVGIVLLIGPAEILTGETQVDLTSLLVLMLAPISWSIGSLQARKSVLPKNVFMSTAVQMITGGSALALVSLLSLEFWRYDLAAISVPSVLATLYLAIFGSIVALSSYVWLLQRTTTARVSTYTYVNPVIAVFLGWLVLGETMTFRSVVAVAIIVSAVILVISKPAGMKAQAGGRKMEGGEAPVSGSPDRRIVADSIASVGTSSSDGKAAATVSAAPDPAFPDRDGKFVACGSCEE
jgi:drug/metabolite transporter (DMT)-like permease